MRSHAKVAVIGGGAMGVSLLYHLTKQGWGDVVLIEKNELTAGSTWHAAGLCTHFAHNITIMNMRANSVKLYKSLEAETGQAVDFHQTGALRMTRSEERMSEFRHVQGIGQFAGQEFNILTPGELKEIYPLVQTDGIIGAIHEPLDGHVDPSQATHAMAKGARMGGAEIYRQNPVEAIERTPSGEWLVHTKNGDITAEIIVNAAGTWCREIGEMMGLDLPMVPMLHQYLVTDDIEAVSDIGHELPIIRDPEESWYVRQEGKGLILGPYEKGGKPWGIDGIPPEFGMDLLPPDLDAVEAIISDAMERIPALAEAGIKTVVNGPITFTPDANPLIGPAFGLDNAWLLTGSSMGVMEGGGAGKLLAEWIVKGEPSTDVLALDSRRFGGYADRDYRIEKAVESFGNQFGIHYPHEEREAGRQKIKSPAWDQMNAHNAVFGAAYGWERPNWFAPKDMPRENQLTYGRANWHQAVGEECLAVRDRVAFADLSAFSKFDVTGPSALSFLNQLGANTVPKQGGVGLLHVLSPAGGVLSEFSVTRLNDECFYLVSAAVANRHDEDLLRTRSMGFDGVTISNVTQKLGVLGIMGPHARGVLAALTDSDLSNEAFPWLSAQSIQISGLPVLAVRVSYVGELGWELHHDLNHQAALFDALLDAGKPFDAGLYGTYAMNAMRLEKGYRAWGGDLTIERTPLESGVPAFVKTKDRDFIGREQVLARQQDNPWRMVMLGLEDSGIDPFFSHTVFSDDSPVGMITSAAYGHRIGMPVALAYIRDQNVTDDTDLTVNIIGREVAASILKQCPYDPKNIRLRDAG